MSLKPYSKFPTDNNFAVERNDMVEVSTLDSTSKNPRSEPPPYPHASTTLSPGSHVHINVEPVPSKYICSWRNGVIAICYFKLAFSISPLVYLVYLLSLINEVLTFEKSDIPDEARVLHKILIVFTITMFFIVLAYVCGLVGAVLRRHLMVLACIAISSLTDVVILSIFIIWCYQFRLFAVAGGIIVYLAIDCYIYFVMVRYYKYLLKKKELAGNTSVEDMTLSQLISKTKGDPNSSSRTVIMSNT